jgi:hypothetical protein
MPGANTTSLKKLGGDIMGLIGENLERAKGFISFYLAWVCFFYYGVSIGTRSG